MEVESHSEAAGQREEFEQTRDYLQRSLNDSNEECRRYYHLYEEFQNERASMDPMLIACTLEKDS